MERLLKTGVVVIAFLCAIICANAQEISRSTIILDKEINPSGKSIHLNAVTNNSAYSVKIILNNKESTGFLVRPGETKSCNKTCSSVRADNINGQFSIPVWTSKDTKAEWKRLQAAQNASAQASVQEPSVPQDPAEEKQDNEHRTKTTKPDYDTPSVAQTRTIQYLSLFDQFTRSSEIGQYLSDEAIENSRKEINNHIECLKNWKDKEAYIEDLQLRKYLGNEQKSIDTYNGNCESAINSYLDRYDGYAIIGGTKEQCRQELLSFVKNRLDTRQHLIDQLSAALPDSANDESGFKMPDLSSIVNILIIAVLLIVVLALFLRTKKKKKASNSNQTKVETTNDEASPTIVVRRKTTSILKRQSLDDVIDNKEYLKIECNEFCNDSAVKNIYLKNTCIKEIYNLYAEDLRNPDNPKEDGCMVLGRWVFDSETNEYDVSLEQTVMPGDDAVFQEYELNFGGKIKLKVAESLRKLRRATNLQYDLTCWVHSHPGLGVFFSNSDCNVQTQLKHPTHPNFLTAIVIDILTPQQELGIFTFRHDSSINSKADLKKMYSLEELHKWAIESERLAFKADDYINLLQSAESRYYDCQAIKLNNSAIIDLCSIVTEGASGVAGWIYGYPYANRNRQEYIVKNIMRSETGTDNELLGCLIIGTHCSIPSIRKAIIQQSRQIKFIFFYSTTDDSLTAIPMQNAQPGIDSKFYGEDKLENLKIWTRRKR